MITGLDLVFQLLLEHRHFPLDALDYCVGGGRHCGRWLACKRGRRGRTSKPELADVLVPLGHRVTWIPNKQTFSHTVWQILRFNHGRRIQFYRGRALSMA